MKTLYCDIEERIARARPRNPVDSPLAVVSSSLLTRQSISRKMALLGIQVTEFRRPGLLLRPETGTSPELALIDADGLDLGWPDLLALLRRLCERTHLFLLISSLNVDQALQVASAGVAGVCIKPFREEEHTERIVDLLNRLRCIVPKRTDPRFVPHRSAPLHLEYLPADDWVLFTLEVADISKEGARIRLPYAVFARELAPGTGSALGTFALGTTQIGIRFRVIHRTGNTVGIHFEPIGDGGSVLLAFVGAMSDRALGPRLRKRRW